MGQHQPEGWREGLETQASEVFLLESGEAIFCLAILISDLEVKWLDIQKLLKVLGHSLHPEVSWGRLM